MKKLRVDLNYDTDPTTKHNVDPSKEEFECQMRRINNL